MKYLFKERLSDGNINILIYNKQDESCLRNRTTLRFDFDHSFMVCAQTSAFWYTESWNLRMRINTKPNGKQKWNEK